MQKKRLKKRNKKSVQNAKTDHSLKSTSQEENSSGVTVAITGENELTEHEKKIRKFLIPVLRRATFYWPAREEAKKAARIERGLYKCAGCGRSVKNGEFQMDHIKPAVNIKGWTGFMDDFIRKLYGTKDEWQILCKSPCHEAKTKAENNARKILTKKKK